MSNIILLHYSSLDEMPQSVRNQVRTMGYVNGTLRQVANELFYGCKGAIVIYLNDQPIGWSACYFNKKLPNKYELGFWIRRRHRNNGYGITLIHESYKQWRRLKPEVFDSIIPIWKEIDNKRIH